MRITRTLMTAVVLAAALASQPVWAGQSAAISNGVTVIRGIDDPKDIEGGRVTRERGVTVFRGNATAYVPEAPVEEDESSLQVIRSGENLWLVDPKTGHVTVCERRSTIYGGPAVRCASQ